MYKNGETIILPGGEKRKVIDVIMWNSSYIHVKVNGPILNPKTIGSPEKIRVIKN